MKILVTGNAGYIGSHTIKELNKSGFEPIGVDNLVRGNKSVLKGNFEICDLQDSEKLRKIFQTYDIDAVIHFAGFAYVSESVENPRIYYRNNLCGSLNLLETMIDFGVRNIIFSSSCAVYGIPEKIPINESNPKNPINPYGWSKLMIERMLEDFHLSYGLKYVSLRYFNAAGADPEGELGEFHVPEPHLIPNVLNAALKGDKVNIFGTDYPTPDGTCIRDYIHVSDLASAHVLALKYILNGGNSTAFNLGNSRGYSIREVINIAEKVTGKKINVRESQRRCGDPPILIASNDKANEILGWKPKYPELETMIDTAWKFLQNNSRNIEKTDQVRKE